MNTQETRPIFDATDLHGSVDVPRQRCELPLVVRAQKEALEEAASCVCRQHDCSILDQSMQLLQIRVQVHVEDISRAFPSRGGGSLDPVGQEAVNALDDGQKPRGALRVVRGLHMHMNTHK